MTQTEQPGLSQYAGLQKRTLTILIITQVFGTVGVGIGPSMGILLAEQVAETELWAGLARSATTLGAALFGIPLGNLAAARGRNIALWLGWVVGGVGAVIVAAAAQLDSVILLFAGLLLMGAGAAVGLQARFAATDLAEPEHKGRSLGLIMWFSTIGTVLGPNLGTPGLAVANYFGVNLFTAAFGMAAVCLFIAGLLIFLFLRPDPLLTLQRHLAQTAAGQQTGGRGAASTPAAGTSGAAQAGTQGQAPHQGGGSQTGRKPSRFAMVFTEFRTNPKARYALIAILSAQLVMVAVMTMTPVHLNHHGDSIQVIGLTISLHILGMYALSPLVGWSADKLGARITISIGMVLLLASLLIGAAMPQSTGGIIASLILLGVGWSFAFVTGSSLFSRVVSDDTRASAQGGADALANLTSAVGAFIAGPVMAITSFSALALIAIIFLVPTAVMTVTIRGVK